MDFGLKERVALVTGGSRGIGRATAEHLARAGARVALTYRQHRDEADAVVAGIVAAGGEALAIPFELGDCEAGPAAVRTIAARWGGLDVLVNNAVDWDRAPALQAIAFEDVEPKEWQRLVRANIEGVYATTQAAIPLMKVRRWGRIVTVSSTVVDEGMRGMAWYGTAKAAMHGLTTSLAREAGEAGILVNIVMPGLTATEEMRRTFPPHVIARNVKATAIGRLPTPADVAAVITFLCSALNTVVTGEVVRPTGGR